MLPDHHRIITQVILISFSVFSKNTNNVSSIISTSKNITSYSKATNKKRGKKSQIKLNQWHCVNQAKLTLAYYKRKNPDYIVIDFYVTVYYTMTIPKENAYPQPNLYKADIPLLFSNS